MRPIETQIEKLDHAEQKGRRKKQAGAENAWTFQHERMRSKLDWNCVSASAVTS